MFETASQLNFLFQMDGVDLSFNLGSLTIRALLGFHITDVYEDGTQEQVFKFTVRDSDLSTNNITLGDSFDYSFGTTTYSFKIQLFTQDMTGCTLMTASYEWRT